MSVQADLLAEIDAFLRDRRKAGIEMAETTFGRVAADDGKFVQRLRDNANVGVNTVARVRAFIASGGTSQSKRKAHDSATPRKSAA